MNSKIAYFDCCSGISGDMVLGALIDCGLDIKVLRKELAKLPVKDYSISASKDERHHITGINFCVRFKDSHLHRNFKEIKTLISRSSLSQRAKGLSISIFETLAKAEAKVHGCKADDVHFHEVGAVDSIIDIVGTAIAIEYLGIEKVYASSLPLGSGWVNASHGKMPVPAPATLEILKDVPIAKSIVASELTTPTGAAIIKTLAEDFGSMPHMRIEKTGYGIGDKSFEEIPNILRVVIGKGEACPERLIVLETNIDDMNPQIYDYLMSRLFKKGALEVFLIPIQMKKGRPAILLKALCNKNKKDMLMNVIFEETTTIGIRSYEVDRRCLERNIKEISTPYGKVKVKVSEKGGRLINIQPEYEDCKKIAEKKNIPLKEVMDVVKRYSSQAVNKK